MRPHLYIAERVFGQPVAMAEGKLHQIMTVLGFGVQNAPPVAYAEYPDETEPSEQNQDDKPYVVIPVYGSLVKRSGGIRAASGLSSYADIAERVSAAANSGKHVILDIDSPGGEAMGMFEAADVISEARKKVKVWCVASPAYSAAYMIASACERIYMPRDSEVGSIGVMGCHLDLSEAERKAGLKYTVITAGDKKAMMSPHSPLTDEARKEIESKVAKTYEHFVSAVSRNRGIPEQAVIDTQAGILDATQAVPQFADRVGTMRDAVADMLMEIQAAAAIKASDPVTNPAWGKSMVVPHNAIAVGVRYGAEQFTVTGGWAEAEQDASMLLKSGVRMVCETPATPVKISVDANKTLVSGMVAPYNKPSATLPQGIREVYRPGCFNKSLANDLTVTMHHDGKLILGRTSAGTARFFETAGGLHFEAELPDTSYARDLQASMSRGDIKGSSSEFYLQQGGFRIERRDGEIIRYIDEASLEGSSIVVRPAYADATAKVETSSARPIGPARADADDWNGHHSTLMKQLELAGQV